MCGSYWVFFFQAEDGIRDGRVTGVQTGALPIFPGPLPGLARVMELIGQDKKVKRGMLTFILLRGIGSAVIETGIEEQIGRASCRESVSNSVVEGSGEQEGG